MSGGDEDLWGDEEDDALLAMMVNPDQVLSLYMLPSGGFNHLVFRVVVVV